MVFSKLNNPEVALEALIKAEACHSDYCFPHRIEAVPALKFAIRNNPKGAKALEAFDLNRTDARMLHGNK